MEAIAANQVTIVVGETGSGKTTQLPKMALEVAGKRRGKLGCTQPRRLAAVTVARRIAEEVGCELGAYVGYQVRFDDRSSRETKLKLMTDGILLAETQADPELRHYHTIVLDEAHERSLNIDFLLGYMKLLLEKRPEMKLIISSATMDAAAFSEFFAGAPVIHAEGRTFPVEMNYMPARNSDEELSLHVRRAVDWLSGYDNHGDVLIFLPGEREIRDCADALENMGLANTDILPLHARLGLGEQQRIFQPKGSRRRIVLATNVAETSLTIPGIIYVVDSGLARISRYLPGRQIQRLQIEDISQASARQRAGRCGRVCEGVCIRLYSEDDFNDRDDFTDPEIKRSALAGVILRMADLKLPPLGEFPLPDPPNTRLINEGYHCLREIGAIDRNKNLTELGESLARLPLDPRLGRMLLEAKHEEALAEVLIIVAGLSIMDPRERPSEKAAQADQAHAQWKNEESDFLSLISIWRSSLDYKEGKRGFKRNQLRKWCSKNYLNHLRIIEWHNLAHDLAQALAQTLRWRIPTLGEEGDMAKPERIHRSLLAGAPLQIGIWRPEDKCYRGAGGRDFAIFPGSMLFRRKKRPDWIMGSELVETSRLWMRRAAVLDPKWIEQVAPQLCSYHAYDPHWDKASGQVHAKQRVNCGGLCIMDGQRISYARVNPAAARDIFIRDGIIAGELRDMSAPFIQHLIAMREEIRKAEHKLRRRDLLWCAEGVYGFFDNILPKDISSERALRQWRDKNESPSKATVPAPLADTPSPQQPKKQAAQKKKSAGMQTLQGGFAALGMLSTATAPVKKVAPAPKPAPKPAPAEVITETKRDILFIPREDCCYQGEDNASEDLYPMQVGGEACGGEYYQVSYKHDPGAPDDGISIGIHIDQLADAPDWIAGWNVPAHLPHRAECLLRLLPKDIRLFIHPIPGAAEEFAEEWYDKEPDRPLEKALAEFVMRRCQTRKFCNASQFEGAPSFANKLLPEYVTKIWIYDESGRELANGTDISELRQRLVSYQEKRFETKAQKTQKQRFNTTPMSRWDCGELPLEVPVGTGLGYPALASESDRAVQVRVYPTAAEAQQAHRAGIMRLIWLRHGDFLNHFKKSRAQKMPIEGMEPRIAMSSLGIEPAQNIMQLILIGIEGAISNKGQLALPRNAEQFESACLQMREQLFDTLRGPVAKCWYKLVEAEQAIKQYQLTATDRFGVQIVAELTRQWNWLTRHHYMSSGGYTRLIDLERYARGIVERIKRIQQQAPIKELERIAQLDEAIGHYYLHPAILSACKASIGGKELKIPELSHALLNYGYMIEEYRLILFAPNLAMKGRSSAKKLIEARESLK